MNFDPATAAKLEKFARELDAPDGERYDDILLARNEENKNRRQALIAEMDQRILDAYNAAMALALSYNESQQKERQAILDDLSLTEGERTQRYNSHLDDNPSYYTVFVRNAGRYYRLLRTDRRLQKMLDES